jgi:hypothetical protein
VEKEYEFSTRDIIHPRRKVHGVLNPKSKQEAKQNKRKYGKDIPITVQYIKD